MNGTCAKYFIDIPSGPKLVNNRGFLLITIIVIVILERCDASSYTCKDGVPLYQDTNLDDIDCLLLRDKLVAGAPKLPKSCNS